MKQFQFLNINSLTTETLAAIELNYNNFNTLSLNTVSDANYVFENSLLIIVGNVLDSDKKDVLNSVLFAGLAAKKYKDRINDFSEWYKYYCSMLNNLGWATQNTNTATYSSEKRRLLLEDVIHASLEPNFSDAEKASVENRAVVQSRVMS